MVAPVLTRVPRGTNLAQINAMGMSQGDLKSKPKDGKETLQRKNLMVMSRRIMMAATFIVLQIITNFASLVLLFGPPLPCFLVVSNAFLWNRAAGLCLVLCFNPPGVAGLQPSFFNTKKSAGERKTAAVQPSTTTSSVASSAVSSLASSTAGSSTLSTTAVTSASLSSE